MAVKFAQYYNVTGLVHKMINEGSLDSYKDSIDSFAGVYICCDTNDFWVARISKDLNEDYEEEEGTFLIERNMIAKYDVIKKVCEVFKRKQPKTYNKVTISDFIDTSSEDELFQSVLLVDDINGLENWDNYQCESLEEAIKVLDSGYGIEEFKVLV